MIVQPSERDEIARAIDHDGDQLSISYLPPVPERLCEGCGEVHDRPGLVGFRVLTLPSESRPTAQDALVILPADEAATILAAIAPIVYGTVEG